MIPDVDRPRREAVHPARSWSTWRTITTRSTSAARASCWAGSRATDLKDALPRIVEALKDDPIGWYRANGITPPVWLETAAEQVEDPEALRAAPREAHAPSTARKRWAHFVNMGLGTWLSRRPPLAIGVDGRPALERRASGPALSSSLASRAVLAAAIARWLCAGVGLWCCSRRSCSGRRPRPRISTTRWSAR